MLNKPTIRITRLCMDCQAYYDRKEEKGFTTCRFVRSFLNIFCRNCGSHNIAVEVEVLDDAKQTQDQGKS